MMLPAKNLVPTSVDAYSIVVPRHGTSHDSASRGKCVFPNILKRSLDRPAKHFIAVLVGVT
jgi:hypothetical protein